MIGATMKAGDEEVNRSLSVRERGKASLFTPAMEHARS